LRAELVAAVADDDDLGVCEDLVDPAASGARDAGSLSRCIPVGAEDLRQRHVRVVDLHIVALAKQRLDHVDDRISRRSSVPPLKTVPENRRRRSFQRSNRSETHAAPAKPFDGIKLSKAASASMSARPAGERAHVFGRHEPPNAKPGFK
jgi:hypothetical protein